jgi:hypothetical protein
MAGMAESQFRKMDQNADGMLNFEEMSESLRAELDKWDLSKDRAIDLAEYKSYFQARIQQILGDRANAGAENGNVEEERKVVVHRAGKLPKELPGWFAELDNSPQDAQVALYEWKHSGRTLQEFDSFDRNGDGFLTVDEVLHVIKAGPAASRMAAGPRNNGEGAFTRNSFAFGAEGVERGDSKQSFKMPGRQGNGPRMNKGDGMGGKGKGRGEGKGKNRGGGGGEGGRRGRGGNGAAFKLDFEDEI